MLSTKSHYLMFLLVRGWLFVIFHSFHLIHMFLRVNIFTVDFLLIWQLIFRLNLFF